MYEKELEELRDLAQKNGYVWSQQQGFINELLTVVGDGNADLVLGGFREMLSKPAKDIDRYMQDFLLFMSDDFMKQCEEIEKENERAHNNRTMWFKGLKDGLEENTDHKLIAQSEPYFKGFQKAQEELRKFVQISNRMYPDKEVENTFVQQVKASAEKHLKRNGKPLSYEAREQAEKIVEKAEVDEPSTWLPSSSLEELKEAAEEAAKKEWETERANEQKYREEREAKLTKEVEDFLNKTRAEDTKKPSEQSPEGQKEDSEKKEEKKNG